MSKFETEKYLASWAGISPDNNESSGKKSSRVTLGNKYLKSVFVQCNWAATQTKKTYFRAKYDSIIGKKVKGKHLL